MDERILGRTKQESLGRDRNKGFTLLEVLVAVMIFSVGLLAVASMQTNAIAGNSFSQRHTTATAVAQGALENVMALDSGNPIFDVPAANAPFDLDPQTAGVNPLTVDGGTYTATITIQPNTPVPNVATITVNILGPGTPQGGTLPFSVTNFKRTT